MRDTFKDEAVTASDRYFTSGHAAFTTGDPTHTGHEFIRGNSRPGGTRAWRMAPTTAVGLSCWRQSKSGPRLEN